MNMKRSLILLCGLLTGFTLQSTKVNAQTQTVANDQKLVYPYTFAPSEGLVNQTEKEHRQEICINGYWDFQPVRLPKEYVQEKGIAPELPLPENDSEWSNPQRMGQNGRKGKPQKIPAQMRAKVFPSENHLISHSLQVSVQ